MYSVEKCPFNLNYSKKMAELEPNHKNGQGSVLKIRFQSSLVKTDPCPYLLKYSPDVLKKKTRVLDIFHTDKNVL